MIRRILVTRPQADAEALIEALAARGFAAVLAPMLLIRPTGLVIPDARRFQAAAVTSGNGVDGLAAATDRRALPVFAVGKATADRARGHGFDPVIVAGGTGSVLVDLIRQRLHPANGPVVWASGDEARVDVAAELNGLGYTVERAVVYCADPVDALPDAARRALRESSVSGALFFSPRTAERFVSVVRDAGLARQVSTMTAHCLSPLVAGAVQALPWAALRTATRPTRDDLLTTLDDTISSDPD